MKSILKKKTLSLLLLAFFSVLSVGIAFYGMSESVAVAEGTANIETLMMKEGASVRVTDNNSENGLRFSMTLSATEYKSVKEDQNTIFGILIMPKDYVETYGELNEENVFGTKPVYDWAENGVYSGSNGANGSPVRIINLFSDSMKELDSSTYVLHASIVDILEENIAREFIGVGYMYTTEYGYTFAMENDNVRSMAYVAQMAIADTTEEAPTKTQKEMLQASYLDKVATVASSYTIEYYVQRTDGTYPTSPDAKETVQSTIGAAVKQTDYGYELDTSISDSPSVNVLANDKLALKLYYKAAGITEISTTEDWLKIWTGDNVTSRLNMHKNYVLTDDIELGEKAQAIGTGDTTGYGFFGTLDGAGYTISWTNDIKLGWNSGFIQRLESGGVIKNIAFKGALNGYITGPVGLCYGTIENCYFDVTVTAQNANQTYGSAVAALCGNGLMRNVISVGAVMPEGTASAIYGKTHDIFVGGVSAENCYALEGTVSNTVNVLTDGQMKTAATFDGWDTDVWLIADGLYPTLKSADFVEPTDFVATVQNASGNEVTAEDDLYTVEAGTYTISLAIYPDNAESAHTTSLTYAGAEGGVTFEDGRLFVDGSKVQTGEIFSIEFVSSVVPTLKRTLNFVINNGSPSISFNDTLPTEVVYVKGGVSLNLADYVTVNNANDYTLTAKIIKTAEGVTAESSLLKFNDACNNTATLTFTVEAAANGMTVSTVEKTIGIVNTVFKQIGTADEWLAIWTGDNEESRLHMYNNYVLTADIVLGSNAKQVGLGDSGSFGLFGTLDGAGHTISWTNELSVGWNSGFIAKIEAGGVVKNLAFEGKLKGTIAGPIGLCYGTVENCFFNVAVSTTHATQVMGSAVAAICGGGTMKNVISIGTVTTGGGASGVYGKEHDTSASKVVTVEKCYALLNTVSDTVNVLTEEEMKTAATFDDWDTDVWTIVDGAYPTLKKSGEE